MLCQIIKDKIEYYLSYIYAFFTYVYFCCSKHTVHERREDTIRERDRGFKERGKEVNTAHKSGKKNPEGIRYKFGGRRKYEGRRMN